MLVRIYGYLSDFARQPYLGKHARLWWVPSRGKAEGDRLFTDGEVLASLNDSSGFFEAWVDDSPGVVWTPRMDYLISSADEEPEHRARGHEVWPHVQVAPGTGGRVGDLLRAPVAEGMAFEGAEPPESPVGYTWWIDTSASPAVLKEWSMGTWKRKAEFAALTVEQPTVYHGTNPNMPRPTVTGTVWWVGQVEPRNATEDDIWADGEQMPFSPHRYPGLHAWYDPRGQSLANNATLNQVVDVSGNGRHMSLANGVGAPTFLSAGMNGTPAFRSDGACVIRSGAFEQVSGPVTIIANVQITNTSNTGYAIGGSTESSGGGVGIGMSQNASTIVARRSDALSIGDTTATAGVRSVIATLDGPNSRLYVDGVLVASGDAGDEPIVRWALFARYPSGGVQNPAAAGSMVGDMAVFATAMDSATIARATAWLQSRQVP